MGQATDDLDVASRAAARLHPPPPVRVFVVAEVHLYREGICRLLDAAGEIVAVGAVRTIVEALDRLERLAVDVVLLDATHGDPTDNVRRLSRVRPRPRIVLVALSATHEIVALAEAGADGFVTHDEGLDRLLEIIRAAARGEGVCSPSVMGALLRRLHHLAARASADHAVQACLTKRERQVLDLIARGHTNQQIARRLVIELSTVKNHVHSILRKLGVPNREEAAAVVGGRPTDAQPRSPSPVRDGPGIEPP